MIFLSHESDTPQYLDEHLTKVAKKAEELALDSKFKNNKIPYYAGLYHDLGKINPYYQELFKGNKSAAEKYKKFHSPYSGWIAKHVLKDNNTLDPIDKQRILQIIYAHHSRLKKEPGNYMPSKNMDDTTTDLVLKNWEIFKQCNNEVTNSIPTDMVLNPKRFKFDKLMKKKPGEDSLVAFLQCGFYFSCMLQADRGSFKEFRIKKLDHDFSIDTSKLHDSTKKSNKQLDDMRRSYAKSVKQTLDPTNPVAIINAPTGIGKTAVFLDAIKKYQPDRIFYFSPLLALTDNMSEKIDKVTDAKEVLVYNHLFAGTLDKKLDVNEKQTEPSWDFDHEAFNEKFVITTTQRLLMTLYSPYHKDKLKLASFRNSLLIIDEVQTLPKFLLHNLTRLFCTMNDYLNIKVLLVSATIPFELLHLPRHQMSETDLTNYLKLKDRKIVPLCSLDVDKITRGSLVMLNTRKAAKIAFEEIEKQYPDARYISSGITKNKRVQILADKTNESILVCTQVLEAGVDISFTNIWRQMAPLDNIIQVLGRLDREAENIHSTAYIFDVSSANNLPYSNLEYTESQKIIKSITNSHQLYEKLDGYYKTISTQNKTQQNYTQQLCEYIDNLDFEQVWNLVSLHIGQSYYDSVYIPEPEDWHQVREDLLSNRKYKIKQHAKLIALLPVKAYTLKTYFDEQLYEQKIFLPKHEKLDEFYDKNIGLDKWISIPKCDPYDSTDSAGDSGSD